MAIRRTTDHDEIRMWVEERDGEPGVIRSGSGQEDQPLTIVFGDPGTAAGTRTAGVERIGWEEFFGAFDSSRMRFWFEEHASKRNAPWSYGLESVDEPVDSSEEWQSDPVEDRTDLKENIYSAHRAEPSPEPPPDEEEEVPPDRIAE